MVATSMQTGISHRALAAHPLHRLLSQHHACANPQNQSRVGSGVYTDPIYACQGRAPAELNQSISLMRGCANMRPPSQYTPSTTSILAYMCATCGPHMLWTLMLMSCSATSEVLYVHDGLSLLFRSPPWGVSDRHDLLHKGHQLDKTKAHGCAWTRPCTAARQRPTENSAPSWCAAIALAPLNAAFTISLCRAWFGQGRLSWLSLSGRYSIPPVPSKLTSS